MRWSTSRARTAMLSGSFRRNSSTFTFSSVCRLSRSCSLFGPSKLYFPRSKPIPPASSGRGLIFLLLVTVAYPADIADSSHHFLLLPMRSMFIGTFLPRTIPSNTTSCHGLELSPTARQRVRRSPYPSLTQRIASRNRLSVSERGRGWVVAVPQGLISDHLDYLLGYCMGSEANYSDQQPSDRASVL